MVQDGEQEVGAEHPLLIRPVALSTVVLQVCKYEMVSQCYRSDTKLPKLNQMYYTKSHCYLTLIHMHVYYVPRV